MLGVEATVGNKEKSISSRLYKDKAEKYGAHLLTCMKEDHLPPGEAQKVASRFQFATSVAQHNVGRAWFSFFMPRAVIQWKIAKCRSGAGRQQVGGCCTVKFGLPQRGLRMKKEEGMFAYGLMQQVSHDTLQWWHRMMGKQCIAIAEAQTIGGMC